MTLTRATVEGVYPASLLVLVEAEMVARTVA